MKWVVVALVLLVAGGRTQGVVDSSKASEPRSPIRLLSSEATSSEPAWKQDEVIVRFKAEASAADPQGLHRRLGSEPLRILPSLRLHRLKLPQGVSVEAALRFYEADASVEYAEPNFRVTAQVTPNDPRFNELWNLHNVGQTGGSADADLDGPEAWSTTTGAPGVVVAVLDSGIDDTHPDLMANRWTNPGEIPGNDLDDDGNGYIDDDFGVNTITGSGHPWDDYGHGTHVAGTIGAAGNNGTGVTGVNWNVRIMTCKFIDAYGSGYTFDAIECLQYVKEMKDRGVNVVATSNSWGGAPFSQALADAIDAQREILFVAAAGNSALSTDFTPFYPASYDLPNVIGVAATDATDALGSFSNVGRGTVHVAAPGVAILSTLPEINYWNIPGRYGFLSGTSMATPHVSGVVALLEAANASRDWRALRNLVLSGGDVVTGLEGKVFTGRRVNANGSLNCTSGSVLGITRPPASLQIGVAVPLQVTSVVCGASSGPLVVTLSGGEGVFVRDDGIAPDTAAGDGVFHGTWIPVRNPERLQLVSPAGTALVRIPDLHIGHYLPEADTKVFYNQTLAASGARVPFSWSLISGALPPGLGLNAATGVVSGLPITTGVFPFTVRVSDAWGTSTRAMSLRVREALVGEVFARGLHEGSGSDARDVKRDASGNIYVLGNLAERVMWLGSYFGGVGRNFLAKYDPAGNLLWLKRYGVGFLRSIALDGSGAIYAAGGTDVWDSGDTLVVKFSSGGDVLWERTYDNAPATDVAMKIAVNGSGSIAIAGISDSGRYTLYAEKLDPSGNPVWLRSFSQGFADQGIAVAIDSVGNVFVGGHSANADYHYDAVVRKYASAGSLVWSTFHDTGSRYDFLRDLGLDGSGNIYALVGPDEAGFNGFVTLKLNATGGLVWARSYQNQSQQPSGLTVDTQGSVYVTGGGWMETSGNDWDYLTLKYDANGNLLWSKSSDGGYYLSQYDGDFGFALTVDGNGDTCVAGTSYNGATYDMLLIKNTRLVPGPGEASAAQSMTARRAAGNAVQVQFSPGCGATDHAIAWGTSPLAGGVTWTHMACGRGSSGTTTFDPGAVPAGSLVYFVVVAQGASSEGSYGRNGSGQERPEAAGVGACDRPRNLVGCVPP
jgi:subtilisin family serine protease